MYVCVYVFYVMLCYDECIYLWMYVCYGCMNACMLSCMYDITHECMLLCVCMHACMYVYYQVGRFLC